MATQSRTYQCAILTRTNFNIVENFIILRQPFQKAARVLCYASNQGVENRFDGIDRVHRDLHVTVASSGVLFSARGCASKPAQAKVFERLVTASSPCLSSACYIRGIISRCSWEQVSEQSLEIKLHFGNTAGMSINDRRVFELVEFTSKWCARMAFASGKHSISKECGGELDFSLTFSVKDAACSRLLLRAAHSDFVATHSREQASEKSGQRVCSAAY